VTTRRKLHSLRITRQPSLQKRIVLAIRALIAAERFEVFADIPVDAIAAVILGGTSIYGGSGAVWRSCAGVILLALINNGFNILQADPFYKDLTKGLIIIFAVAISASDRAAR
jgi:ribose/xylose/arabinose/galactoside ABC-type transport system permease subunit